MGARLSIVIGTYNRLEQLRTCIESIYAQTRTPFHVYVTDGGSTDGTIEYLRSLESETLTPIFTYELVGQAKAYNEVFEQVDTPYVCWLSDDDEVDNRGLDVAVRILDRRRRFGMVALKVDDATRASEAKKPRYSGGVSPIGVLNVNQGLLRTEVLRQVGGFSEWLGSFCIDTDLTAKVLFSGWHIAYTKAVALHHHPSEEELGESREARVARMRIPAERCDAKWAAHRYDSRVWDLKRRIWERWYRRVFPKHRNSLHTFLGLSFFDWRNTLNARFVSALDPLRSLGRPYHLVQRCPRRLRLERLPVDPASDGYGSRPSARAQEPTPAGVG